MLTVRSAELRLALAPRDTYAALVRLPARGTSWVAVRRPLLVAAVLGASMAISATGGVTPSLLLSTTICWSLVVLIQVAVALSFIATATPRTVGLPRALDLFFASHAPWSIWMLVVAAWGASPLGRPSWPMLATAAVPITLTLRTLVAFFREVLGMNPRHAIARVAAHQAITWSLFVVLFGTAVQLWPRILEWIS